MAAANDVAAVPPAGSEPAGRTEANNTRVDSDKPTTNSSYAQRRSPQNSDEDDDYYGERRRYGNRRGDRDRRDHRYRRDDRSRSPRHRRDDSPDSDGEGGRRRDFDRDYDRRDNRRHYNDRRDNRRYNNRRRVNIKNISMEDEIAQLERTSRTVQVFNINVKAGERDLFQFFRGAGPLADIKMIRDRASGRSKGFAYVEFETKEAASNAMMMSGKELMGQCVTVKSSEAEKNVAWHTQQAAKKAGKEVKEVRNVNTGLAGGRVLFKNAHPSLNEDLIKPLFEPFGPVFAVTMDKAPGANGNDSLSGVVQFVNPDDAIMAVKSLTGTVDIAGVVMELEIDAANNAEAGGKQNGDDADDTQDAERLERLDRLDTDAKDGGGMRLTAQTRVELMNKLAANAGIEVPKMPDVYLNLQQLTGQVVEDGFDEDVQMMQGVLGPSSPIPTPCVLLKNAFDPDKERATAAAADEPVDWEREIEEDFRDECSKYGTVLFAHLDPDSKGFVYLKFGDVQSATAAHAALHGRWFNMKRLMAEYQFEQLFDSHFQL